MTAASFSLAPRIAPPKRRRWLAWTPLIALLLAGGLAAAGVNLSGRAHAQSNTVTVQATVGNEIHMDLCGAGNGNNATLGATALTPGAGLTNVGAACTVTFGSNNDVNKSNLKVENNNAASVMFCYYKTGGTVRDCAGSGSFADEVGINAANQGTANGSVAQASATQGKFGYGVTAVANCTKNANLIDIAGGRLYGVGANGSPDTLCTQTTMGTDGSMTFQWKGLAAANQPATLAGDFYKGVALYTATAL